MENLETGKDKVKKICEVIKEETIIPVKEEANRILEAAEQEAHQTIREAESRADEILKKAQSKMEQERSLFESSLKQASSQVMEFLKQEIENKLFNGSIVDWLEKQTIDPNVGAELISVLVNAVEKEGLSTDFSAIVPSKIPSDKINALLTQQILEKLKEHAVVIGDFEGGIKLKLHDRKLTLDLSMEAIKELLEQYIRKDFRSLFFQAEA